MVVVFHSSGCHNYRSVDSSLHLSLDLPGEKQIDHSQEVHLHDRGIQTGSMVLGVPENVPQTLDYVLPHFLRIRHTKQSKKKNETLELQ